MMRPEDERALEQSIQDDPTLEHITDREKGLIRSAFINGMLHEARRIAQQIELAK